MNPRLNFYLCLSAIITAVIVTTISGLIMQRHSLFWETMAWQVVILALLTLLTNPRTQDNQPAVSRIALWLLLPAIYGLGYRTHLEFFFIYTIIWIACAPIYLSTKQCWAGLFTLNLVWYLYRAIIWGDDNPLMEALLVATFHAFALLSALVARESAEANEQTQKLNRELLATQHLLGEASRESERTRIARDLHDLLGHHLTALTINLQVASRLSEGEPRQKIEQCHALSKLLLSDVREAVSALREMPVVNLNGLLEVAIRDIPRLTIDLVSEHDIELDDVNTAEALLRCVQEAITNTLKHSKAHQATIETDRRAEFIRLKYQDDGDGCDQLKLGNGLTGMRERFERIGGGLELFVKPSFTVIATVPVS